MQEERQEDPASQHRRQMCRISTKGEKMMITQAEIQSQIEKVREELKRSKDFVNANGYNCTTALFFIVQQYRLELKRHLNTLMINLDGLTEEGTIQRTHQPIGACISSDELKDALGLS